MTPAQYDKAIRQLGFTSQELAGEWLGVSRRTGQRYAANGPPEPVARLLRMMIRLDLGADELR